MINEKSMCLPKRCSVDNGQKRKAVKRHCPKDKKAFQQTKTPTHIH